MKHPVHPLVVHFPIACWSLSTLGDLMGIFYFHNQTQAIEFLLLIGCISAIVAMAAGLYEVVKIKITVQISATIDQHMYAAVFALGFYSLSLYLRWDEHLFTKPTIWAVTTSVFGFISLVIAGWYGATLVYRHGVRVKK